MLFICVLKTSYMERSDESSSEVLLSPLHRSLTALVRVVVVV